MITDKRLVVIEHPKSLQLLNEITEDLKAITSTIQFCFEHLDEKTEVGREIGQMLGGALKATESIGNKALLAKNEGDLLHSSLVKVQNELPDLKKQVNEMAVRLDRQGKRHHDREKDARLTGQWAAVRGNGRH